MELAVCAQSACQVVLWEVGRKFCDTMLAERSLPLDTPGTCRNPEIDNFLEQAHVAPRERGHLSPRPGVTPPRPLGMVLHVGEGARSSDGAACPWGGGQMGSSPGWLKSLPVLD